MTKSTPKPSPLLAPGSDAERGTGTAPAMTLPSAAASDGEPLLVRDLGWSEAEAIDTHFRLRPFEDDWNAPGMDAYDDL
jgi:hypothetical protein